MEMDSGTEVGSRSEPFLRDVLIALRPIVEEFRLEVVAVGDTPPERWVTLRNSVAEVTVLQEIGSPPWIRLSPAGASQGLALDFFLEAKGIQRERALDQEPPPQAVEESLKLRKVLEDYGIADAFPGGMAVFLADDLVPRLKEEAQLLYDHCSDFLRGDFRLLPRVRAVAVKRALAREKDLKL